MLLNLISRAAYFYSMILVVYALLSWFPGGYQSSLGRILSKICEPYISLFDRLPLRFGPMDFTILASIVILNLAVQGLQHIVLWMITFAI
ncbi:YggT family protein [Enterococcus mundtii]|uniref:YggT family protein n=1 Tax=Enterococcus mundtii TaxID=53346 RepID=UPI000D35FC1E|nr:YggT family protein [Enterococcus mundtii]PTO38461.1 YggT family protein [Enterococcus mundtii]PTO44989.1 YggT family protein [Enterococcus mundtii]